MRFSHFAVLNCNLFLCAAYISDKIGPIIVGFGWLIVFFVAAYFESKGLKNDQTI